MRPEECESWNAPDDPDCTLLDPSLIGLPATPANVEALRTARAVEDFKDDMLSDEGARLRLFAHAALSQAATQKLAQARSKPKSNSLADALHVVAEAARARGGKLWPSVRDAVLHSFEHGDALIGDLEVTGITGKGFADAHAKRDLTGTTISFRLPDGTQHTISGATTYNYIMR